MKTLIRWTCYAAIAPVVLVILAVTLATEAVLWAFEWEEA